MAPLPFDLRLAGQVKAETLEPHQQPTPRGFKIATDFRQQVMLKHPALSDFHSRAEHLHAGLLEGEPAVTSYVPQPFPLRIGKRRYTPDCYVVADNARRRVVELKPEGKMDEALAGPLSHFFTQRGMDFQVVSNESVYAREVEAENWLEIVRILHMARAVTTTSQETELLERFAHQGPCTLGDLIDPGDRERTYQHEIALFRLLHRGQLRGDLTERPLDFDTGLFLCA
jgi:hypothetical protein